MAERLLTQTLAGEGRTKVDSPMTKRCTKENSHLGTILRNCV